MHSNPHGILTNFVADGTGFRPVKEYVQGHAKSILKIQRSQARFGLLVFFGRWMLPS
jgi:hypothetical protein